MLRSGELLLECTPSEPRRHLGADEGPRRNPAFSDFTSESIALVAEGDRVVHHSRSTGTHTGTLFGIPPTGKRVTVDHVEIWRIEDGKIVEQWGGTWEFERIANELRCDA